ncbi:MAG: T9SS type A sorting domain-containing protein [Parafilimonas sp.]|nr:T9SS type A sorting domain-containing protein [Parafilimonas sp.]
MQNKNLLRKAMLFVFAAFIGASAMALPKVYVSTNITTNTTWTSNKIYVLTGLIYVTNNATLTIQPGTVIYGNDASSSNKGSLIITRGAKIQAVGTPCRPIVFTSGLAPAKRARGDWGGLILLGYAAINPPGDTAHIEGIVPVPETRFGGGLNPNCGGGDCPDNNDNSGTLEYVRVEYAGVALSPNNEINGITFGGVGSGTTVDHVQVSYSNDDSYEWFGGNVNAKYLIAYRGIDDDFDTDNGYSGKVQFGVGLRDPKVADISGSKGFESDNDANGSTNLPQTKAIFSNITIDAGGDTTQNSLYIAGAHIRRNSDLKVFNSVLMGYPTGVLIDGTLTQGNVVTDTLLANNIIAVQGDDSNYVRTVSPSDNASVVDLIRNHAANRFYQNNSGVQLTNPYNLNNPNLRPKSGSPAISGASFAHAGLSNSFFQKVSFVGALPSNKAQDWTHESWVNFRPDTTVYNKGAFGSNCSGFVADKNDEVSENVAVADVKLSPNPNKGAFNIALSGFAASVVNVKISDLNTGRIYFIGKANNNTTTNISIQAPNGNYVVELTDGKTVVTRKVSVLN